MKGISTASTFATVTVGWLLTVIVVISTNNVGVKAQQQQQLRKIVNTKLETNGVASKAKQTLGQVLKKVSASTISYETDSTSNNNNQRQVHRLLLQVGDDNKCNNNACGVHFNEEEEFFATAAAADAMTSYNTAAASEEDINTPPLECLQNVFQFIGVKFAALFHIFALDVQSLVAGLRTVGPCTVRDDNVALCNDSKELLFKAISISSAGIVTFPINLIYGIFICGTGADDISSISSEQITSWKQSTIKVFQEINAKQHNSNNKRRMLLSSSSSTTTTTTTTTLSEQEASLKLVDNIIQSLSDDTFQFVTNYVKQQSTDKKDNINLHDVTRRYLQSTPFHGRTLREVPKAVDNQFDLDSLFGFNDDDNTTITNPDILESLFNSTLMFPSNKKFNTSDPDTLMTLLNSLILSNVNETNPDFIDTILNSTILNVTTADPTDILTSLLQLNATTINETDPKVLANILKSTISFNETDPKALASMLNSTMFLNDTDPMGLASLLLNLTNSSSSSTMLNGTDITMIDDILNTTILDPKFLASLLNSSKSDDVNPMIITSLLNSIMGNNKDPSFLDGILNSQSDKGYLDTVFGDFDDTSSTNSTKTESFLGGTMGSIFDNFLGNMPFDDTGIDSELNFDMSNDKIDQINELASSFFNDGFRRRHQRRLAVTESNTCTLEDEIACLTATLLNNIEVVHSRADDTMTF